VVLPPLRYLLAPDDVLARATELDRTLQRDPHRAREALRRLFVDGKVVMTPLEDGSYEARATLLPLVALGQATKREVSRGGLLVGDGFVPSRDVRLDLVVAIASSVRGRSV
jgi:hypothetical protein